MGDSDDDFAARASGQRQAARAREVDLHIANRIRERRITLGMSQQQLAQLIGVTYQQAHKYESGANRLSVGRLYEIAKVFSVKISWFYEGLETSAEGSSSGGAGPQPGRQRLSLEMMRSVSAIGDQEHLEALGHLARALSARRSNGEKS